MARYPDVTSNKTPIEAVNTLISLVTDERNTAPLALKKRCQMTTRISVHD
jgi:hypothetical protein